MSLGLGEETISASSVLVMPMVSSRTTGFRGNERSKYVPLRTTEWSNLVSVTVHRYPAQARTFVVAKRMPVKFLGASEGNCLLHTQRLAVT
jgi:hypothetical protein